eukprot:2718740-Rhodomonas_salina.1
MLELDSKESLSKARVQSLGGLGGQQQKGSETEHKKKQAKLGCCAEEDLEVSNREGQPERQRETRRGS